MPPDFSHYTNAVPLKIGPMGFGLNDTSQNRATLQALLKLPARKVASARVDFKMAPVMRTGTNAGVLYIVSNDQLVFYVKYGVRKLKYLPKTITQFVLWRKLGWNASPDLTRNIFFKILLPITGSVMSDKEQTDYGQDFWTRRLTQALRLRYDISLVDLSGQHIYSVTNEKDLARLLSNAWGSGLLNTPDHKDQKWLNLRWVISAKPTIT